MSGPCPATFGREAIYHNWVRVTASTSERPTPYVMCTKCGETRAIADQSPKGRDAKRLDAKHASGGPEGNRHD